MQLDYATLDEAAVRFVGEGTGDFFVLFFSFSPSPLQIPTSHSFQTQPKLLVLESTPTNQPSQLSQDNLHYSRWKACESLGSTSYAWIPLQAARSSTEGVAICRLSAARGLIKI